MLIQFLASKLIQRIEEELEVLVRYLSFISIHSPGIIEKDMSFELELQLVGLPVILSTDLLLIESEIFFCLDINK